MRLAETLGEDDPTVLRRLRQNEHELLAAVPGDDVHLAHRVLEQRADLAQHAVADEMARLSLIRLK